MCIHVFVFCMSMGIHVYGHITIINHTYICYKSHVSHKKTLVILTRLLYSHLPYVINYHERLICFMQLYNGMTQQISAFPKPCDLE